MKKKELSTYRKKATQAIGNRRLQSMLRDFQHRYQSAAFTAYQTLPEGPSLRQTAHRIRAEAIDNLDILLEALSDNVTKNGGKVFFADDAAAALSYCTRIAQRHGARLIVKGKSMVTEEIGLNAGLAKAGMEVYETDLGEFIIQLAGETPSHIIAPAVHKNRQQIAHLFVKHLGIPYSENPEVLANAARKALREKFLKADIGISGCNLACAETGHITTISNEGNIRMATTLPKVHIVIMAMEKIAARLEDHHVLLRLLVGAATGRPISQYLSYIGGPADPDHVDGPEEFHLVILDNGRSRILADPEFRESLYCIRCAACLNACPVYGKISGHAYGFAYSGPIGAVITPLLTGLESTRDLFFGETLCGACKDICPVMIDLPRMLLALRARYVEGDQDVQPTIEDRCEQLVYNVHALLCGSRPLYEVAAHSASILQRLLPENSDQIKWLPSPVSGWTTSRDIISMAKTSFVKQQRNKP